MTSNIDFQAVNWWAPITISGELDSWQSDYTRHRSGGLPYASPDDIIGRPDYQKFISSTSDPTTVTGTGGTIFVSH